MTTRELKQQIDKVLGNSIRCLLPSYWWKRVFGAVIDNTISKDEVKTINGESILGEGDLRVGVKSVTSVEELNALDAQAGDIATIGKDTCRQVSVGSLERPGTFNIPEAWDKLTRIDKVEKGTPYSNGDTTAFVWLHSKSELGTDLIQLGCKNGVFGFARIHIGQNEVLQEFTIDELNALLKENDYRYVAYNTTVDVDVIDDTIKLYVNSVEADAYIKGDSWERLAKESDLEGIEGGGGSESETKSDTITFILRLDENYNLIPSDEDKEHNKESFKKYTNDISAGNYRNMELQCFLKDVSPMCVSWDIAGYDFFIGGGTAYPVFYNVVLRRTMFPFDVYFTEEGEPYISPHVNVCGAEFIYYRPQSQSTVKDHNAKVFEQMNKSFLNLFFVQQTKNGSEIANVTASCVYLKYEDYFLIQVPSGSTTDAFKLTSDGLITQMASQSSIDDALSTTSQRAVQNKVVTAALNNKADKSDIKTINGVSLLGGGDITISGGGVSEDYVNTAIANAITTTLNTAV